jgi:excisionase family DNA binding protein
MTIEEGARYLFVSHVHVQRLIERGDLTARPMTMGYSLSMTRL